MPVGIMLSHGVERQRGVDLAAGFAVFCFVRYAHYAEHREYSSQHTNLQFSYYK